MEFIVFIDFSRQRIVELSSVVTSTSPEPGQRQWHVMPKRMFQHAPCVVRYPSNAQEHP